MKTLRRHLRACCGFALLAILTLALLPTVSHALGLASPPDGGRAEVCTPQGVVFVALASGDLAPTAPEGADDHHSACCTGAALAALPVPPDVPAWAAVAALLPGPAQHHAAGGPPWSRAQPRAPPLSA